VKDIKFKPGSIVIQSSESESNDIVSSNPMNVKLGAVEDDTSTRNMKSLAPYYDFAGIWTMTGVSADDISIVVTA